MMTWLLNNISTIIICIVLTAVIAAIISYIVRNKKQGNENCLYKKYLQNRPINNIMVCFLYAKL